MVQFFHKGSTNLLRDGIPVVTVDVRPPAPPRDLLDVSQDRRFHRRDADGFDQLYQRHYRAAVSIARRYVRDPLAAEDIAQESFLALWKNRHLYRREQGSVRTWLMAITHNRAIDATRRARARPQIDATLDDWHPSSAPDDVAAEIERGEERRVLRQAIAALPASQREVIGLSAYAGLTQVEIARRTGAPLGTVKSRSRLAMAQLRSELAA